MTFSKAVELRSLRSAAVSGSGQSARLTNSYLASATASFGCEVVRRRLVNVGSGLSSDCLKSSRDSATFRPIPADGVQCSREEKEEEQVEKRRGVWSCFGGTRGAGRLARGEEGRVRARMGCMRLRGVSGRRGDCEWGEEGAVASLEGGGEGGKI